MSSSNEKSIRFNNLIRFNKEKSKSIFLPFDESKISSKTMIPSSYSFRDNFRTKFFDFDFRT